jgi:hypothetical protein
MLAEFFAVSLGLVLVMMLLELMSPSEPEKRNELTPTCFKLPDIGTH